MENVNVYETEYSNNEDRQDGCKYFAKFERTPFSSGACRNAFKGTLFGTGPRGGSCCVAKTFKPGFVPDWIPDLKASLKASKLAEKFNSYCLPLLRKFETAKIISFVVPLICKLDAAATNSSTTLATFQKYVTIEPYIDGKYKKFNSNNGWEDRYTKMLVAFSHWTWHFTDHKLIVCDLQGVEKRDMYFLTDPAIHSLEHKYGLTDLGKHGIKMVFGGHECNEICRALRLWDARNIVKRSETYSFRSSLYSFQLSSQKEVDNWNERHVRRTSRMDYEVKLPDYLSPQSTVCTFQQNKTARSIELGSDIEGSVRKHTIGRLRPISQTLSKPQATFFSENKIKAKTRKRLPSISEKQEESISAPKHLESISEKQEEYTLVSKQESSVTQRLTRKQELPSTSISAEKGKSYDKIENCSKQVKQKSKFCTVL